MALSEEELRELFDKYKSKLKGQIDLDESSEHLTSSQYNQFKMDLVKTKKTWYEKACSWSESILKLSPDAETARKLKEMAYITHMNVTPEGVMSFSVLVPMFVFVFFGILSFLIFNSLMAVVAMTILALILFYALQKLPFILADSWRLKASSQMVLAVFYVVTYMRHTSNLELAIKFAAQHLSPPLSVDLKRILWDVETQKFPSVKESLDNYLETWKKWSPEFVESMHLVESSLLESSEDRRINALEKALSVMLDETYEKMLHYAHNLKSPITMLHMFGIILPLLGLVMLPLAISFLGITWYELAFFYNIILPIIVYFLGKALLSSRPTGYGDVDISQYHKDYEKFKKVLIRFGKSEFEVDPKYLAVGIFVVLFLIGLFPVLMHLFAPSLVANIDASFKDSFGGKFSFFGYVPTGKDGTGGVQGPFGLGAAILSLFIPLAFGLSMGVYLLLTSHKLVEIREKSKSLEQEFASALFQLANRIGDGLPVEIACQKVAQVMKGTLSGKFFEIVSTNLIQFGMGIEEAIFNKDRGALVFFPSNMIESSMKVLVESAKKGPSAVSNALMNVSTYIKEMHRVNERLKDLLADTISSMKTQISFITPLIAGIVVGLASMITNIMQKLGSQLGQTGASAQSMGNLTQIFGGSGMPTYYFQIVVGVYVVEVIYILAGVASNIENGSDKLGEHYYVGNSLVKATLLYVVITFLVVLMFNLIAGAVTGGLLVNGTPSTSLT